MSYGKVANYKNCRYVQHIQVWYEVCLHPTSIEKNMKFIIQPVFLEGWKFQRPLKNVFSFRGGCKCLVHCWCFQLFLYIDEFCGVAENIKRL